MFHYKLMMDVICQNITKNDGDFFVGLRKWIGNSSFWKYYYCSMNCHPKPGNVGMPK